MTGRREAPCRDQVPDVEGERVTEAKVRFAEHPSGRRFAIVTLDNGADHTKPNTFGPGGLKSLDAALDTAFGATPDALVVTGKPFWFVAGFDLTTVQKGRPDRTSARALNAYAHAVLGRLATSEIPTFAFVNGAALGGGLELALHCRYRTLSSGVPALGFPETFLGLVPAWGGTFLLPNLVGAEAAVKLIVENPLNQNRLIKAPEAFTLGLADAMFSPADFLEVSLDWAAGVLAGTTTVDRRQVERGDAWDAAIARGRAVADARVHAAAPAPYRALDLLSMAESSTREDAFAAEDEAAADLVMSEELRAGLYAFDLVQRRAKRPVGAPDPALARAVTKVGVVGAGLMASQLALLFLRRLHVPVVLTDIDQERLDRGVGYVLGEIDALLGRRRISYDEANRLRALVTGTLDRSVFSDVDFVVEAVFEELSVKKQVLAELEGFVKPDCVLATNTSSLSVSAMAADLAHPERVVGFHFFNPVAVMPLLEVARGARTDDVTYATAFAVGKQLKKTCIPVADAPAFVANRLFLRFLGEVFRAMEEGTPVDVADHALDPLGLPMSPTQLLAFSGTAVTYHVAETLHAAFPDRYPLSDALRRLAESGASVYGNDGQLTPEFRAAFDGGGTIRSADEIRDRALAALADEIRRLLDEGVVAEPADVDLALITGGGYPFHLGGVTPYLDRTGVSERVTGRRFTDRGVASLP